MSDSQWHYATGTAHEGPVSFSRLQELAAAGVGGRTALVWQAGTPQWVVAGTVSGLFPEAVAPPPLPEPVPVVALPMGYYVPPTHGQPRDIGQDAGIRMLIPVGRSGWAIAAGYLGLLSVLVVPAPLAIIFGILAVLDIKRHPDRHGMGRAIFGMVMGGLVILGLTVRLMVRLVRF